MLGAIYIGLSGMNAYSSGLQTISNNVANLNSPGFKSSTVQFSDLFGGSASGFTFEGPVSSGGRGSGVRFSSPLVDFDQGDLRQTNNPLDLAIRGNGFLILESGGQNYYARTGSFAVDTEGYISLLGAGYRLTVLDSANQPTAVNVSSLRTDRPVATASISLADNLSSTGTTASVTNLAVFDSAGGRNVWRIDFSAVGSSAPGEWNVTVKDQTGATLATHTLKFIGSIVDPLTSTLSVSTTPTGADPLNVAIDFSSLTSFSSGSISSIRAGKIDGKGLGNLIGVTIDETGQVKLTYSNTETRLLGAVALADFQDPQQLERFGNGLFVNRAQGDFRILGSASEGVGTLVSGQVEASNVDLSQEFGDLILIQRGFQASSQVVGVANDMIQELFGIRGRG